MIRNVDAVNPCSNSEFGIFRQRDALDNQFHARGVTQAFYKVPVHSGVCRIYPSRHIKSLQHGLVCEGGPGDMAFNTGFVILIEAPHAVLVAPGNIHR